MKTHRQLAIEATAEELAELADYDRVGRLGDFYLTATTVDEVDQSVRSGIEELAKLLAMTDAEYDAGSEGDIED
jgi:hypothetical protein